ncbi:ParA family protein [Flavobacteriaceae bacterium]|nr:ParA family protein [Flavobacteriaceae bacterium]
MFHVKQFLKKQKIISIVNQKGGVGKTTTVVNLATACAVLHKKKILVIDLDPQGNTSTFLGFSQQDRDKTLYDFLVNDSTFEEVVNNTVISNLKVITSNLDLSAAELDLGGFDDREFILKNKLNEINEEFDFIFIDCPPSLGLLTINALSCSDSLIIPMQCEFFSLEGLSHLINTIELVQENLNEKLTINGIILTMYDKRNKLTEQVEDDVRGVLGDKVYKNNIPRNIRLSEAPSHMMPAIVYDPRCSGSLAYLRMSKEFLTKEINHEK